MISRRIRVFPKWASLPATVLRVEALAEADGASEGVWLEAAIGRQEAIDRKMARGREAIRRFNGEETIEVEIGGT